MLIAWQASSQFAWGHMAGMIEGGCDRRMAPIQPVLGVRVGEYIQFIGLDGVNDALANIGGRHASFEQVAHEVVLRPHRSPAQAFWAAALGQVNAGIDGSRRQDRYANLGAPHFVVQALGQGDYRVFGH
jgi:hypothetical protein